MPQRGTIMVHAFTSRAQLPVVGATVVLSQRLPHHRHTLLAVRITNENGEVPPISVPVPTGSETQAGSKLYSLLDIWVEHPLYQLELIRNVQVFPGVDSVQKVALVPLAEHAIPRNSFRVTQITPQQL